MLKHVETGAQQNQTTRIDWSTLKSLTILMFDWALNLSKSFKHVSICNGWRHLPDTGNVFFLCATPRPPAMPYRCPENQLASWWSWNVDSTLAFLSRKDCLQRSRACIFYDMLWRFMHVLCSLQLSLRLHTQPWGNLCWEAFRWDHLDSSCQRLLRNFLFDGVWQTLALDIPHTSQTLFVRNKAFGNRALNDLVLQNGESVALGKLCLRIAWTKCCNVNSPGGQGHHNPRGWESSVMNKYRHLLFEPGLQKLCN